MAVPDSAASGGLLRPPDSHTDWINPAAGCRFCTVI